MVFSLLHCVLVKGKHTNKTDNMETDTNQPADGRISPAESQSSVTSKASLKSKSSGTSKASAKSKSAKTKRKLKPSAKKVEQEAVEEDLRKGILKHTLGRTTANSMSSARRQPRSGARAGPHDSGEEQQMWKQLYPQVHQIGAAEVRAKELKDQIVELEFKMKEKLNAGGSELRSYNICCTRS